MTDEFALALAAAGSRLGPFQDAIRYFPTIDSTNERALALAAAGAPEGTTLVAEQQTAGRGRRGRTWFSPPGSGLYVSVVLRPASAMVTPVVTLLTLTAGVALTEGVRAATGLPIEIKWPNDLVLDRRKLAGILAEAVSGRMPVAASGAASDATPDDSTARASARADGLQAVVLGFGINIRPAAYPPEIAHRATSIEAELGRSVDRGLVLAEALAALAARYDDLRGGRFAAILSAWRALAPSSRGSTVQWTTTSGVREGRTEGIDDSGALLVRTDGGMERIVAGELIWK